MVSGRGVWSWVGLRGYCCFKRAWPKGRGLGGGRGRLAEFKGVLCL